MLSIFQWVNTRGKEAALLRTKHFRSRVTQRDDRKKEEAERRADKVKAIFVIIASVIECIII